MKKFYKILLFSIIVISCKQKIINEKSITKKIDRQYFFGFDRELIVDTNLFIPDSLRLNSNDGKRIGLLLRYFISDSTMCFKYNDNIYIKAQYNVDHYKSNYSLIKIGTTHYFESKWRYGPNTIHCGTDKPVLTLIGRRLILNKSKYEINDTVEGKLFLKYYADYEYIRDSSERFKLEVDSFLFKYRLYQGSVNSIKEFENDYDKN